MNQRLWFYGLITAVMLSAAACNREVPTKLDQFSMAIAVDSANRPETAVEQVPSSTKTIYFSAQVLQPLSNTRVRVRWTKLPSTIIASEDFNGRSRRNGQIHDFDKSFRDSYFASSVDKTGLTWDIGDYQVEAYLNGKLVKTLLFQIVSDLESENQATQGLLKSLKFGNTLNASREAIVTAKTTFSRSEPHIYVQSDYANGALGSEIEVTVRFIKEDLVIVSSSTQLVGNPRLLLDLELSRLGRFWSDRLWAPGVYEVNVKINDVDVKTSTFTVQ